MEEDKLKRYIFNLYSLYQQFFDSLDSFFDKKRINDELNRLYLRLYIKIEEILNEPGFEGLYHEYLRPFKSLIGMDFGDLEIDWENGLRQICGNFLSLIDEFFIKHGEVKYKIGTEIQNILKTTRDYLVEYNKENDNFDPMKNSLFAKILVSGRKKKQELEFHNKRIAKKLN